MNRTARARRRERRERARIARVHDDIAVCLDFDAVFSFDHLMHSAAICARGVRWKTSTARVERHMAAVCTDILDRLRAGTYRTSRTHRFTLVERGKLRRIAAVAFRDRIVQRTLCDWSLVPMVRRSLIHDNGASLAGKGTSFARARFEAALRHAVRVHDDPYVLLFDFSDYFASIPRERLWADLTAYCHRWCLTDAEHAPVDRILAVLRPFVFDGGRGLGLGNQTSQTLAIWYPNRLDHAMAAAFGAYGRYMDDGYVVCADRTTALKAKAMFESHALALGLIPNPRKTRIVRVRGGVVPFLKRSYRVRSDGRLVVAMNARAARLSRRHLRRELARYDGAVMGLPAVRAMLDATVASSTHAADRRRWRRDAHTTATWALARRGVRLNG